MPEAISVFYCLLYSIFLVTLVQNFLCANKCCFLELTNSWTVGTEAE